MSGSDQRFQLPYSRGEDHIVLKRAVTSVAVKSVVLHFVRSVYSTEAAKATWSRQDVKVSIYQINDLDVPDGCFPEREDTRLPNRCGVRILLRKRIHTLL